MSRFFRSPSDDSQSTTSPSESESPDLARSQIAHRHQPLSRHRDPSAEDDSESHDADRSTTRSSRAAISDQSISADSSIAQLGPSRHVGFQANMDTSQHQGMLLATLLEAHYRNRAAEFLNKANPGHNYTQHSPEVQPLAQQLFNQASTMLQSAGIVKAQAVSEELRDTRAQYLAGLDQLGAGASPADLLAAMRQLNVQPNPSADGQLTTYAPPRPKSHYQNSFRELCLLGRGGFGRVFKCQNLLDQKTYAVKKIPLSPHLSKSFTEGRHEELQHVLVEVQTLASLDHANIVRYHATWVEEPQATTQAGEMSSAMTRRLPRERPAPRRQQLLLETAANSSADFTFSAEHAPSASCGFVFAEDSNSAPTKDPDKAQEDSESVESEQSVSEEPSASGSDIFTNGTRSNLPLVGLQHEHHRTHHELSHTHELYIQMSLYPMTLFHYLSSSPDAQHPRHCYHLLPSLQILLAILSGLRYLWSRRLIHRDIKPRNIFLSAPESEPLSGYCDASCQHACQGQQPRWLNPRIGDFGLVTQLAHGKLPEERRAGKQVGTPFYRPPACAWDGSLNQSIQPEQLSDNEKVDVFALGVVFVELMCPFSTAMERADVLGGLQKGVLPECLRARLEKEGFEDALVSQVLELCGGMIDPDPVSRWDGGRITETAERIKAKIGVTGEGGDV
ncbi:kinase-like domain-containing protein [Echria macrotheca]|uniref:Kinase-like domain-containing protein n=1 Tax=Echria macrotheca TaxID=438768 RepID=A0AAJ0B6T6_9PEZI|nr:kinase-like domain-containing protein [Echria macrotheca]